MAGPMSPEVKRKAIAGNLIGWHREARETAGDS